MDCGADDTLCQALSLIFGEHGQAASALAKSVWAEHGEKIIALAGLAFGIYRYWRYRENFLHKRLAEYLHAEERRLRQGQSYVLNALQRPRPGVLAELPLFASPQLRRVMQRHNWDGTVYSTSVEDSIDAQLELAKSWVERHLETANATTNALREQLSTVNILRGAVAASDPAQAMQALGYFRTSLAIAGHENDATAKELEAHTLRKLGRLSDALEAYKAVEQFAVSDAVDRDEWLIVARAKRYQAEITQALAVDFDATNKPIFRKTNAFNFVGPNSTQSALGIRARFAPYEGWEQLEQADTHYLASFLANVSDFGPTEQTQLNQSQAAYEDLAYARRSRFALSPSARRLRKLARKGLERIRRARKGDYDADWLLPALNQPKYPTDSISRAGGE
jgi:hypothetical protein